MSNRSKTDKIILNLKRDFEYPSYDDWYARVEKILKGADFEKSMIKEASDGILLKPIYNKSDNKKINYIGNAPGEPPYARGFELLGYSQKPWLIAQAVPAIALDDANKALRNATANGQTAIKVHLDRFSRNGKNPEFLKNDGDCQTGLSISTVADFEKLLADIDLKQVPVFINAGTAAIQIASMYFSYLKKANFDLKKISGGISGDPLTTLADTNSEQFSYNNKFDQLAAYSKWALKNCADFKTIGINTTMFHNSGAGAATELGFGMATAVEYLREMTEREISLNDFSKLIRFEFAVGSEFFTEIAKLRASRLLWSKIVDECGGSDNNKTISIHCRTSNRQQATLDIHTNILRAAGQAFAAVIGGCDSLEVTPFDSRLNEFDELSYRNARNIQILIKDESNLGMLADPSGGSWYIESLTDELAEKAWQIFTSIEKEGGMTKALENGTPQSICKKSAVSEIQKMTSGDKTMIGVNKYLNPDANTNKPDSSFNPKKYYGERSKRVSILSDDFKKTASDFAIDKNKIDIEKLIVAASQGATIGDLSGLTDRAPDKSTRIMPFETGYSSAGFEKTGGGDD